MTRGTQKYCFPSNNKFLLLQRVGCTVPEIKPLISRFLLIDLSKRDVKNGKWEIRKGRWSGATDERNWTTVSEERICFRLVLVVRRGERESWHNEIVSVSGNQWSDVNADNDCEQLFCYYKPPRLWTLNTRVFKRSGLDGKTDGTD